MENHKVSSSLVYTGRVFKRKGGKKVWPSCCALWVFCGALGVKETPIWGCSLWCPVQRAKDLWVDKQDFGHIAPPPWHSYKKDLKKKYSIYHLQSLFSHHLKHNAKNQRAHYWENRNFQFLTEEQVSSNRRRKLPRREDWGHGPQFNKMTAVENPKPPGRGEEAISRTSWLTPLLGMIELISVF